MKVWDMHCDTLAELLYAQQAGKPKSFLHNGKGKQKRCSFACKGNTA